VLGHAAAIGSHPGFQVQVKTQDFKLTHYRHRSKVALHESLRYNADWGPRAGISDRSGERTGVVAKPVHGEGVCVLVPHKS
jgi:hypothetical protein